MAVDPHVIGAEYITFFPAVTAATLVGGLRAGFVSVVLSFAAVLFLLPPRLSFYVENPAQYPVLALFVLIMISEVIVAAGMRLALERYHELSQHLEGRVEARTAEALLRSRQLDAANQRLRQSNDELMAVYDQGLYAAYLDMDGKVFRATRACVEGCGFIPGEIIGKRFWECGWFNKPETQAWVRNGFELAASGVPFRGEVDYVFKNGTEHTSETAFIPIRDDDDRVAFIFVPGLDVTERVRQYRATFENAAVGIAHLTPDLKWHRVNDAVTRITGYSAAELATKTMPEITHPDDVEASLAQIEQARKGKANYDIEKRYMRKDGTITWVRSAASGVRNSDGSIDRFVLVFGDITDSKQAEQLLQRQAELLNQSHDAILTWKISGPGRGIVYWSQGAETLYGYTAAEARGRISHELLHTRAAVPMEEIEAELVQKGSWRGDLTHTTRDGREIVVESRLVRVSYDGELYALEANRDITERKRAEELVRRQAELLDQSHDAIFTWEIGGGITYWNRGAETMYGYTAADAMGRDPHELLQTRSDLPMQEIEAQIAGSGSWYGELTHTTRDGRELLVESSHVRVFYDGHMHALETNRDITARKHAEEQIHLLMREVNHRSKNMLSLVQAIARQTTAREPEDFIGHFTERIQALAANQDLIIRNEWRGIDVEDLVRTQLAHFADLVGSRIAMHGAKLHLTAAAAQAIGLALHELATNAGKYGALSTDAGRIDIGWQLDGDIFTMSWTERGGPPVQSPERRGFGSTVIESMVKRSLNGEVQLDYAQSGLEWRLTCQATKALEQVRQLQ